MGDFLEAVVLLLPADAGGRLEPISPREGTYRPLVGSLRARFIEGPPTIDPGSSGLVVVELETVADRDLVAGSELPIIEQGRVVGLLTVTRLWRNALAV
jgi:hypothetical protein